ncbi:class III lanthionine synthetase LanKC [Gardnerella sp. KA00127]|uniref:class III lanthionine synthetase LanKC n=1 Tax=Gardnerella sp. KA00127 TaxID=2749070 RepID=UPI003BAB3BB1
MYQRYFDSILESGLYYQLPKDSEDNLFRCEAPDNWETVPDSEWTFMTPNYGNLPIQGWKLHVSSRIKNAQRVLDIVAKFCFRHGISFKYAPSYRSLLVRNSKGGNRVSAGKFITIYPSADDLESTMFCLNSLLEQYREAPYILSDMRFQSGPVYYRYGGFVKIFDQQGKLCILNPDNKKEEDIRVPYYRVPDWVKTPDFLLQDQLRNETEENSSSSDFHGFEVQGALHFSTGGGVYSVLKDNHKYVMKEGRPFAGLDAAQQDAIQRISHEADVLRDLEGTAGIPEIVDEFDVWEHHYIIQTYHEKMTFGRWIAISYPFNSTASKNDVNQYLNTLDRFTDVLVSTIKSIHKKKWFHGDIQPHNILVDPDSYSATIIDFETASSDEDEPLITLGTPGYYDSPRDSLKKRDWIGLYRTIRGALLPIGTEELLGSAKQQEYNCWIASEFGSQGEKIISKVRLAAVSEGFEIESANSSLIQSTPIAINTRDDYVRRMVTSLLKQVDFSKPSLGYGDPLQHEGMIREYCLSYGAAGIWNTLLDYCPNYNNLYGNISSWLRRITGSLEDLIEDPFSIGLYTGISGFVGLALRIKDYEIADTLVNRLGEYIESTRLFSNLSLESGLAGVILTLAYYYRETGSSHALDIAEKALKYLKANDENDMSSTIFDENATKTGLLFGKSGFALAALAVYKITNNRVYLEMADEFLQSDVNRLRTDDGLYNLWTDDGRLMPYFSLGSAGLAIVMSIRESLCDECDLTIDYRAISNTMSARPCAHAGLFKGEAGLLGTLLYLDHLSEKEERDILRYASLYLVEARNDGVLYAPGDFSYRFSTDLATGLCGWIYALSGEILGTIPGVKSVFYPTNKQLTNKEGGVL